MPFTPFEVTIPHITYACLGGFIVLFGMFSLFLRSKLYISEACWAFLFGVIIGPYCAGVFDPRAWADHDEQTTNTIVLEFSRVVLAIGVFAIGVELPKAYMRRHWKSLFFLLVPVMTFGWVVSAAFIYALIPNLNFVSSLLIAACLTPTDPILAAAVIGGKWADKHVPAHLRHLLAAESACNDGAAFPFLFLALYLLLDVNAGRAIRDWFLLLWLYQIFLAIIMGALLGFAFRHLMKFCERHNLIDRHSYVAQYISLAIFTIGITTLLGTDDLLAAFACGTAFAWDGFFNRQTEESVFSSVIDLLFNIAAFIFVGAWMPFNTFQNEQLGLAVWRLVVIAVLVLLFRRLPVMMALYRWIPDVKNFREALFSGHFGPIGIGAVFISTFALESIHKAHPSPSSTPHFEQIERVVETIHPIVGFLVLTSITVHGLSIPSFSLGRRVHSVSRTWSVHSGRTWSASRTWSRHATATGGVGAGAPEWTMAARLVRSGDEIVINRDRGDEEGAGRRVGEDVDVEKGLALDLEKRDGEDSDKTRGGSRSGASSDLIEKEKEGEEVPLAFGAEDGEVVVLGAERRAEPEVRFVAGVEEEAKQKAKQKAEGYDVAAIPISPATPPTFPAPPVASTSTPGTPTVLTPPAQAYYPRQRYLPGEGEVSHDMTPQERTELDWREENFPDGGRMREAGEGEEITEWRQGRQRIIERRAGPGEDVEVTVIHDPPAEGSSPNPIRETMHELERTVSKELMAAAEGLHRVGSRVREVVSGPHLTRSPSTGSGRGSRVVLRMRRRRSSAGNGDDKALAREKMKRVKERREGDEETWESDEEADAGPSTSGSGEAAGRAGGGGILHGGKQFGKKARLGIRSFVAGTARRRGSTSGGHAGSVSPSPSYSHGHGHSLSPHGQGHGGGYGHPKSPLSQHRQASEVEGGEGGETEERGRDATARVGRAATTEGIPSLLVTPTENREADADGRRSPRGTGVAPQPAQLDRLLRDAARDGRGGRRTRESSPARSIRFAEGTRTPNVGGSGSRTPVG